MHFPQMHLVRTSALLTTPYKTFNTQYPVPNEMNSGSCTVGCRVKTIYLPVSLQHQLQHETVRKAWRLKFWAKGQLSTFEWHYGTLVFLRASSLHAAEISTAGFCFRIFISGTSFIVVGRRLKTDTLDRGRLCWCKIGEQFLKPGHFVFQKWIYFYNLITSWTYPQHKFSWF